MLRCAGSSYLGGKVLKKGPRDRGEEVHVGWGVKPLGKIACDGLDVSLIGFDKVDDRDIGNGVSLGVDVPLTGSLLAVRVTRNHKGGCVDAIQMNGHPPSSKIVDSQDTADDIPAHTIKHQDLPDWITIFIQDWSGVGNKTAMGGRLMCIFIGWFRIVIQVQEFLN